MRNLIIAFIVFAGNICFSQDIPAELVEKYSEDSLIVYLNKWRNDSIGCDRGEIMKRVVTGVENAKMSQDEVKMLLGKPTHHENYKGQTRFTYDYFKCPKRRRKREKFFITFLFEKGKFVSAYSIQPGQ